MVFKCAEGNGLPVGAIRAQEADAINQAQLEVNGCDALVVFLGQLKVEHLIQIGLQTKDTSRSFMLCLTQSEVAVIHRP